MLITHLVYLVYFLVATVATVATVTVINVKFKSGLCRKQNKSFMFTLPHSMTLLKAGKICCIQGEKAKALMPVHRVFKGKTQNLDSKNPPKTLSW